MKLLLEGLPWEPRRRRRTGVYEDDEGCSAEEAARAECIGQWGTDDDCLVVDVAGRVMLNTTDVGIEEVRTT